MWPIGKVGCSARGEMGARSQISLKRTRSLRGKAQGTIQLVRSDQPLTLGVVDQAAFGSCGPCGDDPPFEAARAAGGQEIVQGRTDRLRDERRIARRLRDGECLVPTSRGQELAGA
jgi:hypothetical protein